MKQILVLGPGCPKCEKLKKEVEAVAQEMGIEHQVHKVSDLPTIMQFGVMTTPALVVDGEVKVVGKVPSAAELKKLLS